jgi:PqqD family protein of HPr-rel-A system
MADPHYSAAAPDCLIITKLDEVSALFHRPSGMTHIVVEPVPEIIAALQQHPLSVVELLKRLSVPANSETKAAIDARLAELEAGGLISRQ